MSQVSPYARSTAERSHNRNATTLFVAIGGAIFFAVLWLADPAILSWAFQSNETRKETLNRNSEPESTRETADTEETSRTDRISGVDWAAQVEAIEHQLPDSHSLDVSDVKIRLQSLLQILEGEKLPEHVVSDVQRSLEELHQQAEMLRAQSSRPNVDAEGFDEGVASTARRILLAEQELVRQARENSERKTRQQKEPTLRDVRLALRDNQDKATDLRRQIARMQQEQSEFREKAARAEALRLDMTDVKRYLQPFTAPGYLQPKSDRNAWDTERTVDATPVSLARLKRLGALEDTMEGLERLYIFGGGKNPVLNNSRPLGAFPEYAAYYLKKPNVLHAVKRAQQLLREHGQALVEQQLLSP
ncbi:MAG: hypothetical protein AAF802_00480 [Planctomycetota bacterium]